MRNARITVHNLTFSINASRNLFVFTPTASTWGSVCGYVATHHQVSLLHPDTAPFKRTPLTFSHFDKSQNPLGFNCMSDKHGLTNPCAPVSD